MIGAEADVAGARRTGAGLAILIRTGKCRPRDENRSHPPPDLVVADLPGPCEGS